MIPLKLVHLTRQVALAGEGVGRSNNNRLAACLFDRKHRVLECRANTYKTHPLTQLFGDRHQSVVAYPHLHAEMHVCISHGLSHCEGLNLLVLRVLRNGQLSMARPCDICTKLIQHTGIRRVYYSDWDGQLERL